ncbi:MAG TPA: thioredoxin domain-containing protein, partial [Polyangiaceae bacterium]|nr:thioredoxin domain-containing protein [Polyangiaceae bacterium]
EFGDRLRVVARQRPLPFHAKARPAALAALAAAEQGKYWPMHERLFAGQESLDAEGLERAAREAGLDVRRWRAAMDSKATLEALERDAALAGALAVRGILNEELARADAMLKAGTRPADLYAALVAAAPAPPAPEGEGGDCGGGEGKDCGGGGCPGAHHGGDKGADKADGGECHGAEAAPGGPDAPVEEVKLGEAPARGPADAPVTLVVFSDFQCPFCARAENTVAELEKQYAGKLRILYKSRPLPMHKEARLAARAALAADEQGKFWPYHDALLANQRDLERPALERIAREIGLRADRFAAALDSDRTEKRLAADLAEAERLRVAGTPTFFINGRRLVGAQPVEAFRAVIDKELERAKR